MGGGGGAPSSNTTYTNNLPEYAQPYFERLMDRTEAESNRGYSPYSGQRVSNFTGDQNTGFGITRDMAARGTPDLGMARDATNSAIGTANGVPMWNAGTRDQYMSPYMDAVVDRQKQGAIQDFAEGQGARNQEAITRGAFGGYRDAVTRGVAERGLGDRLADIEAQGLQAGYENAQAQMERDRAAQFQGSQIGLAGSQQLQGIASLDQGLTLQRAGALQEQGGIQQAMDQRSLDMGYQDFVNQRDYPRQQLNFYSSILRGVPVQAQQEVTQYSNPNPYSQMAGLGIAGLGAYRMLS